MTVPHGGRSRYLAGCRCDDCRDANATWFRHYRATHPTPTHPSPTPRGTVWDMTPPPQLDRTWQRDAACATLDNVDLFFPSRGEPTAPAKEVCATCPVREPCLNYALEMGEKFGIWGGLSERERRRLRRTRRLAAAAS